MAARFKCKKCKTRFDLKVGREIIQACIDACEKKGCPLRNKSLSYIPLKPTTTLALPFKEAANEEVVEILEEEPIRGFISQREIRKQHEI